MNFSSRNLIEDFIKRHRLLAAAILLSVTLGSFLTVLIPLSIGKFYELALNDSHSIKGQFFDQLGIQINSIQQYFEFFLLLLLLTALTTYVTHYLSGVIAEYFSKELREELFHRQMRHTVDSFNKKSSGKYLLRYSGDLSAIQKLISTGIITFTGDIIFLTIAILILLSMNATLTIVFIVGLPVAGVIIYLMNRNLKTYTIKKRDAKSSLVNFVHTRLNAFTTIKFFNRETPEENQFNRKSEKLKTATIQYVKNVSLLQSTIPILFYLMLGMVLYLVALQTPIKKSKVSGEQIFVFVLLTLYMRAVIKRVLKVNTTWQNGKISLSRMVDILNYDSEPHGEMELKDIEGNIRFRNVNFAYNNAPELFKNISFWIEPNSITVFRGPHGIGKSTVLKLMMKLMPPSSGNIFIDDYNYKDLAPHDIRKQITLISDDAPVLGNTVFEAISYNKDPEKRDRVKQTLAKLQFTLTGNPDDDLEFRLDPEAKNLSAGQRKMLVIARALNTKKKIILMDEPFTDLDDASCAAVVQLLNKLKRKRTIIAIAANLPADFAVDKVIDLEQMQLSFENTGS